MQIILQFIKELITQKIGEENINISFLKNIFLLQKKQVLS
jgi:hypothetical protein